MDTVLYWYHGLLTPIDHGDSIVLMNWRGQGKAEGSLCHKAIAPTF